MDQISGTYRIYSKEGLIAEAKNVITNQGREMLAKGVPSDFYLAFSRDIAPGSKNRVYLPHRDIVRSSETVVPGRPEPFRCYKGKEKFFKDLKNGFMRTGTKLIFKTPVRGTALCKIALFFGGKLFSEALLTDSKGNIIYLEASDEPLLIIYELSVVHNTNPIAFRTKTKNVALAWNDTLESKLFDCFSSFGLVEQDLDPKFNYELKQLDLETYSLRIEASRPFEELYDSVLIPTTRGHYKLIVEEGFPLNGEEFFFNVEIKMRYD